MKEKKSITGLEPGDVVRDGGEYVVFMARSVTEPHGMFFRLTIPRAEDASQKDKFTQVSSDIVRSLKLEGRGWCLSVRPIRVLDSSLDPLEKGVVNILGNVSKNKAYTAEHVGKVLAQSNQGPILLERGGEDTEWQPPVIRKANRLPPRRNKRLGHEQTLPSEGRTVSPAHVTLRDACKWKLGGLTQKFTKEVDALLPAHNHLNLLDMFKAVSRMPDAFEETPEIMALPITEAKEKGWLPSDNRMDTAYAKNGWKTLGDVVDVMRKLGESDVAWKDFGVQGISEERFQGVCDFYAHAVDVATQRQEKIANVKKQMAAALEDYSVRAANGTLPAPSK